MALLIDENGARLVDADGAYLADSWPTAEPVAPDPIIEPDPEPAPEPVPPAPLAAPVTLTATANDETRVVTKDWAAVTGAAAYEVWEASTTTGPVATVTTLTRSSPPMTRGVEFRYSVRAIAADGTPGEFAYAAPVTIGPAPAPTEPAPAPTPGPEPADSFVLRTTVPDATNTGHWTAESTLVPHAGNLDITTGGTAESPRVISGLDVEGVILVRASHVRIEDCLVRMHQTTATVPTDLRVGIRCWQTNLTNVVIRRTTVRVAVADQGYDKASSGIQGSGFIAERCDISGTIDGIFMVGVSHRGYAEARGNFIHDLPHDPADPGFADGSHNDGIQVGGNLTRAINVGNTIHTGHTSAVIVTQDSGTYDIPPVIDDNTLAVGDTTYGAVVNIKSTMTVIAGLSIKRNTFPVIPGSKAPMVMSQAQLDAAAITSHGADRNDYADGTYPVRVWNGVTNVTTYPTVTSGPVSTLKYPRPDTTGWDVVDVLSRTTYRLNGGSVTSMSGNLSLDAARDYVIYLPGVQGRSAYTKLWNTTITGGRHLYIPGGEIDFSNVYPDADYKTPGKYTQSQRKGLQINGATGHVYMLGVRIHGNQLNDALWPNRGASSLPNGEVPRWTFQQCIFEDCHTISLAAQEGIGDWAGSNELHQDGIQAIGSDSTPVVLALYEVVIRSGLQGIMNHWANATWEFDRLYLDMTVPNDDGSLRPGYAIFGGGPTRIIGDVKARYLPGQVPQGRYAGYPHSAWEPLITVIESSTPADPAWVQTSGSKVPGRNYIA